MTEGQLFKRRKDSDKAFDGLEGFFTSIEEQRTMRGRKDDLINETVL